MKYNFLIITLIIIFGVGYIYLNRVEKFEKQRKKKKVCIVGGGISGVTVYREIMDKYDVTLYEADEKLGGACETVEGINMGVMYMLKATYPYLFKLFKDNNIKMRKVDLGIIATADGKKYWGSSYKGKLWEEMNSWILQLKKDMEDIDSFPKDMLLIDYLKKYSKEFRMNYVYPLMGMVLATDLYMKLDIFAKYYYELPFLHNTEWEIPEIGAKGYIEKIAKNVTNVKLNTKVTSVERTNKGIKVNGTDYYDYIVFCIPIGDLKYIIKNKSKEEKSVYETFKYFNLTAILHNDESVYPKNMPINALYFHDGKRDIRTLMHNFDPKQPHKKIGPFLTYINDGIDLKINGKIYCKKKWKHLIFDRDMHKNKMRLQKLQGKNKTYYAGIDTTLRDVSHEMAYRSGLEAAEMLNSLGS